MERFIQADTMIPGDPTANSQLLNRYSYALNNPLRFTDPSGNSSEDMNEDQQELDNQADSSSSGVSQAGNASSKVNSETPDNGGSGVGSADVTASSSWRDSESWKDKIGRKMVGTFYVIAEGTYKAFKVGNEIVDVGLDVVGVFDPTPYSDGLAAVRYAVRGDFTTAGISALAIAPFAGDLGKAAKYSDEAVGFAKWLNKGEKNYSVYKGFNKAGDDVYVGITNKISRRQAQHGPRFRIKPVEEGLTKNQAMNWTKSQ